MTQYKRQSAFDKNLTPTPELVKWLTKVKAIGAKERDKWNAFAKNHFDVVDQVHDSPFFLPWHRALLILIEPQTGPIPYWDWGAASADGFSDDDEGYSRVLFEPDSLSIAEGATYLAGWKATTSQGTTSDSPITRNFPDKARLGPPTPEPASFPDNWDAFRAAAETLHNVVHNWVGGTMATALSPSDPMFYLLHSNLDRLWYQWQLNNPKAQSAALAELGDMTLPSLLGLTIVQARAQLDLSKLPYTYD